MGRLQELLEASSSGNAERQPAGLPDSQLPRRGLRGRRGCGLLSAGETKGSQPEARRGLTGAREAPLGSKAGLSSPRSSSRSKRTSQCFNLGNHQPRGGCRAFPDSLGCSSVPDLSRRREGLLKSPLGARQLEGDTASPRSPAKERLNSQEPPRALPWTARVPASSSSRNLGFGIPWIYFLSFIPPHSPFMAPGGGGERKEIGIFLIKMQFYKYFFHLMLQELNITFLLLDLR